jgi:hypothetical protein
MRLVDQKLLQSRDAFFPNPPDLEYRREPASNIKKMTVATMTPVGPPRQLLARSLGNFPMSYSGSHRIFVEEVHHFRLLLTI